MNAAAVGPSEFEQVVKVVGNAQQLLLAVVGGSDGMHQQVSLGRCANDGTVAVGSVAEHGPCHVGAVAVMVFRIVSARAQAERGAGGSRRWEGKDAGDVVPEIRVHVGVVHTVIQARVGHGDDDAAPVQTRPCRIDVGHVGAVPGVVDVHDLNAHGVHDFEERTGFHPFNLFLLHQPGKAVRGQRHGGESPAVGIESNPASVVEPFGQGFARKDDVHHGPFLIDEGVRSHHLKAQQTTNEVGLHLVGDVHGGQAHDVELRQGGGRGRAHVAVETGRRHEGIAVNAGGCKVEEPIAGHRVGVAEDVKPFHPLLPRFLGPIAGSDEADVAIEQVRRAGGLVGAHPPVLGCV